MAGNSEPPNNADAQNSAEQPAPAPKPHVRSFNCKNCGSPVTLRCPGISLSVTCPACQSIIDTSDDTYAILATFKRKTNKYQPLIELGKRGKLDGKEWEVVGFMIRKDQGSNYKWEEYLLFNPYYGYRWLLQASGHWNFTRTIKRRPAREQAMYQGAKEYALLDNRKHKIFYNGRVSIEYVFGEFYWKAQVGSAVSMIDYVAPPYMLSLETDGSEKSWSLSTYMNAREVQEAFQIPAIPAPKGIAPNQPTASAENFRKILPAWAVFLALLFGVEFYNMFNSSNALLMSQVYPVKADGKVADITSPVFKVTKPVSNVELDISANVDNSWLYAAVDLVNDKTGETYSAERTVEYYHGRDSDGSWSEGSTEARVLFSPVPQGDYYFNVDTEGGLVSGSGFDQRSPYIEPNLRLTARADVPSSGNFFWSLLLLSLIPVWAWWRRLSDEMERWSESAYDPYPRGEE